MAPRQKVVQNELLLGGAVRFLGERGDFVEEQHKVDAEGQHQGHILEVVEIPGQEADGAMGVLREVDLVDCRRLLGRGR